MGKNKRKRSSGEQVDRAPVATAITPPEPRSVPGISPADLQATARTLSALLRAPALLRAKECKSIRTQLYSLLRALSLSANTKLYTAQQLSHLVNEALEAGKWAEALVALDALHALDRHPKLGSVQRWIARIGSIWGSDMGCALASAIIRSSSAALAVSPDVLQHSASIIDGVTLLIAWDGWDTERGAVDLVLQPQEQQLIAGMSLAVAANEEGPTDGTHLKVWRDTANTLLLEPALSPPMVQRFDVPFAEGAFGLQQVLSACECARLVAAANAIGFVDASGYSFSDGEENSLGSGAAGIVWLADSVTTASLLERIRAHLPACLPAKRGALAGINARFRFYKYTPGAVYKPHIDGAWPGSGITSDGAYALDAFGDRHSRMTLILYLNDDFEGGETRFFFNARACDAHGAKGGRSKGKGGSAVEPGGDAGLHAQGVTPRAGGCLLFPHGDASSGVVHEGSAVVSGCKYIVRTDVLYLNAAGPAQ